MLSSLVAVDRNLESSFALRTACRLGGRVRPIHVVESPARDMSFGIGWARHSWEQEAVEQARLVIDELVEAERYQCPAIEDPLLRAGDYVQQIATAFNGQGLDLLVLGVPFRGLKAHGLAKRFSQYAEKAHREIPALLVRGLGPIKRVSALTDGSQWAEDALGLLARSEPAAGREITLVGISPGERPDPEAETRELNRGAAILEEKGIRPAVAKASELSEEALLEQLRRSDLVVCPLLPEDKRHHHLTEYCESACRALLIFLGRPPA
jgi:hypothetical protein